MLGVVNQHLLGIMNLAPMRQMHCYQGRLQAPEGCFCVCETGKEDANLAGDMPFRAEQD